MEVYRICHAQFAADLSGKGAALYGGRWNSIDTHIVYTAESRALALLEIMVHAGHLLPQQRLITIDIPDSSVLTVKESSLPPDWNLFPSPDAIKELGDRFIQSNKYLVLKVPSALMPEEHNLLLNPYHREFKKVHILSERALSIDERLYFSKGNA